MSTTLPLPGGAVVDPAVDARWYAAAVRGELADLGPEVVEELTGGLEADLAELAAESSTPLADRLGDPRGYATELRSAAGLPPRGAAPVAQGRRGLWARTAEGVRDDRERLLGWLRSQRWWPGAVERARQLRPAWWVTRGLVAAWLLVAVFGAGSWSMLSLLMALAAVAVSVELGRDRWGWRWLPGAVLAGNVLSAVCLPFVIAASMSGSQTVYVDSGYVNSGPDTSTGVWVDGQQVTNLYPYDAQGQPLTGVQLLDDFGRPVETTSGGAEDWSGDEPRPLVPAVDAEGALRWNSYPLKARSDTAGAAPTTPPLPQPTLPALVGLVPSTPSPVPTTSPVPTAAADGVPGSVPSDATSQSAEPASSATAAPEATPS